MLIFNPEESQKTKITKAFIIFTLSKFRNLDLKFEKNKKRLIDGFVNAIFVCDNYIKLILNFDGKLTNIPTSDEIEYMANSSTFNRPFHQIKSTVTP